MGRKEIDIHSMRYLQWPLMLVLLSGLAVGAYYLHTRSNPHPVAEVGETPKRAANAIIKLGAQLAESHGIKDEPAQAATWQPRVFVYGRVVPNPRAAADVRVPFPCTLRSAPGVNWPALGTRVDAGQTLALVDVRFGPQERLDLLAKLNEARAKQRGAEEMVKLQQERVLRLEAAGPSVSRGELDTALTQLTEARTQFHTAAAVVKEWQDGLAAIDKHGDQKESTWSQPLTAPVAGEITELTGRPGMALEAGAVVAHIVDFRHVLVRVELPTEILTAGAPSQLELTANASTLSATRVGPAPQVEVGSQMAAYWYEVDTGTGHASWRPGLFVKAAVPIPQASARAAVSVPGTALLYHQGRALVYVRLNPGRFERREVEVLGRDQDRWVLASGVAAGEHVVSQRAQVLLSEEFRGNVDDD